MYFTCTCVYQYIYIHMYVSMGRRDKKHDIGDVFVFPRPGNATNRNTVNDGWDSGNDPQIALFQLF